MAVLVRTQQPLPPHNQHTIQPTQNAMQPPNVPEPNIKNKETNCESDSTDDDDESSDECDQGIFPWLLTFI